MRAVDKKTLEGKVAIVTGASSGIGAATAVELAGRGATVILAARRALDLDEQVRKIVSTGGHATSIPTDISDPTQVAALVESSIDEWGRVDVLVNNAGVFWRRSLAQTSAAEVAAVVNINLLGAMLTTQAVLPGMLERRSGSIISVGSLSGRVAMEPLYSATKYGLRGFSLALRRQLAGSGVFVSLVSPGNIRTAMTSHLRSALPGPELVAGTIADLVVRPRREVVIPRLHYAIAWLEQASGGLADQAYHRRRWSPVEQGE
jgi:NADP-dependent 3-hydroxy acid dehydrogenase YdfG